MNKIKKFIKKYIPDVILCQRLPVNSEKKVLITFDDGPCEKNTPKVLEILDKYNAKAMFFVVGNRVEKSPQILSLISDRGHLICNHSYCHPSKPFISPFKIINDLKKCNDLICKFGSQNNKIYRPPCGKLSIVSYIVTKVLSYKVVFWSLEGQDWNCKSKKRAVEIANDMSVNVSNGDIILLHDDNLYVLTILETLLPLLIMNGFSFTTSMEKNNQQGSN